MLPDRTLCYKAIAEDEAGESKTAATGKEAVLHTLTSVNNREATE